MTEADDNCENSEERLMCSGLRSWRHIPIYKHTFEIEYAQGICRYIIKKISPLIASAGV